MLQQQLLQERQQFEAWRASQAQPQPQPPISSSGLPSKVGDDVEINAGRSASVRLMQGCQPVLKGLDLKTRPLTKLNVQGLLQHLADPPLPMSASAKRARPEDQTTDKAKRARSASTSRRSPSPKRDYPRGTCTATRPSQASPKRTEHTLASALDLEAFKADKTSSIPVLEAKGTLRLCRLWLLSPL